MSWPWHLIGPFFVFLAVVFPVLIVTQDHGQLGTIDFIVAACFIGFGLWNSVFLARYSVTLVEEGFVLRGIIARKQVAWRNVTSVRIGEKAVRFFLADGRTVELSIYFSGLGELFAAAERELPPVVWQSGT